MNTQAPAVLVTDLDADLVAGWTRILPGGPFRANDGRPRDVANWLLRQPNAQALIARWSARRTETVVDYEHQTLHAEANGQPAPAAGWIEALQYRIADGLYARIRWTKRAKTHIAAGEYRYLSPVFQYDRRTGEVLDLLHVGLTNFPALDGLDAVARAAARARPPGGQQPNTSTQLTGKEAAVCKALGLAADTYVAAKNAPPTAELNLTPAEQAVCKALGLAADTYVAAKNESIT